MKVDLTFLLENAGWPAFVVETAGTIRQANHAAIKFFGPKLEGETISLAALWADSTETVEHFLVHWERASTPVVTMRYRGKGGAAVTFATHICSTREQQRRYLFQLIPEREAGALAMAPTVGT